MYNIVYKRDSQRSVTTALGTNIADISQFLIWHVSCIYIMNIMMSIQI